MLEEEGSVPQQLLPYLVNVVHHGVMAPAGVVENESQHNARRHRKFPNLESVLFMLVGGGPGLLEANEVHQVAREAQVQHFQHKGVQGPMVRLQDEVGVAGGKHQQVQLLGFQTNACERKKERRGEERRGEERRGEERRGEERRGEERRGEERRGEERRGEERRGEEVCRSYCKGEGAAARLYLLLIWRCTSGKTGQQRRGHG